MKKALFILSVGLTIGLNSCEKEASLLPKKEQVVLKIVKARGPRACWLKGPDGWQHGIICNVPFNKSCKTDECQPVGPAVIEKYFPKAKTETDWITTDILKNEGFINYLIEKGVLTKE